MLNIISVAPRDRGWGGATQVYRNTVRGLRLIRYPFVVNRTLSATERLWVQSDVFALPGLARTNAKTVLGPNLFVLPSDIPRGIDFTDKIYLQPSEWYAALWTHLGFRECELAVWPAGIDTDLFRPRELRDDSPVLVYFKRRDQRDLDRLEEELRRRRLGYRVLHYGTYTDEAYRELLSTTSFVIWLGVPETQGVALQEALAADVAVLVWDATRLGSASHPAVYRFPRSVEDFPATSAPYFDGTCGIKFAEARDLPDALDQMTERLQSFRPREFVLEHLSLEGQARALLGFWRRWGLAPERGYEEPVIVDAPLTHRWMETLLFRWRRRFGPKLGGHIAL